MVPISKGDPVPELSNLIVCSDGGEYADVDLIMCAEQKAPTVPVAMYQAQYIRYGSLVYRFDDQEALGAAIVAVESGSTHDAAQLWREEETRRIARKRGTLVPENPTPAPNAVATEEAEIPESKKEVPTTVVDTPAEIGSIGALPDSIPGQIPDPLFITDPTVGNILIEPDPSILDLSPPDPIVLPPVSEIPQTPAVDLSTTTLE